MRYCQRKDGDGIEYVTLEAKHLYIVPGYTDMRKQINGLAYLLQQEHHKDPFDGCLYLFCGRSASKMKALLWQGDGFILLHKRLESGRFRWPRSQKEVFELTQKQLGWLLQGLPIHQPKAAKDLHPKYIAKSARILENTRFLALFVV